LHTQILRFFTEAIELFEDLLKIDPSYLPAIKGIAEAHSGLSAHLHNQRLLGRARDHAQYAVTYLAE
jgi:superkiller protein 3